MIISTDYYSHIENWLISSLKENKKRPIILALSAPQGTGKSTLARHLVNILNEQNNLNSLTVSIDDFYLKRDDQLHLAKTYSDNPFLQNRGYPGTHDIELMNSTLTKLMNNNLPIKIPRYDKSRHQGKGDRHQEENWNHVNEPIDVIIFEGWMLGFSPVENPPHELLEINDFLKSYSNLNSLYDLFIHLHSQEAHYTFKWRAEAENKRRRAGDGAMSKNELHEYLHLFKPAFDTYNPLLLERSKIDCPFYKVTLGENREIINQEIFT